MVDMRSLLLIVVLGAIVYADDDDKIVGGYECQAHSQPWQVSLNSGYHFCGGSLINNEWVLSAAHCYRRIFEVRLGEHNVIMNEGTEQFISPAKILRHPRYNEISYDNDIMLIKLSRPAQLNGNVQPVPLPKACPAVGTLCTVSGWGDTLSSESDERLRCVEVPIVSIVECQNSYLGKITDSMLCAGFPEGGKDSCQRDSGGPLTCNGVLYGVVSWGFRCAERNFPGVYANVCKFTDWIQNTMAAN
ncbi:trypsin-2-like [Erpetoichthys calabaricus]|uniref:trypsin n=1 Tax=Erpetoichthys calabaricus TaxID=27687 RepID=A0A8C4T9R3_ERPCA|nr:trypsin-2-like [Erpetoichthys calabaricus]